MFLLQMALAPARARTVISFDDKVRFDPNGLKPTLTVFEHIEGSRVTEGLFPEYTLPNGRKAYMYYKGGNLMDEAHVDPLTVPMMPVSMPSALQSDMPLAGVLHSITKPPGSVPAFMTYRPVPRCGPFESPLQCY